MEKYPMDILFIRTTDNEQRWHTGYLSIILCEIFNGNLVKSKLTDQEVVMLSNEGDMTKASRESFKQTIQKLLSVGPIESFALQPKGEQLSEEVKLFIKQYSKRTETTEEQP